MATAERGSRHPVVFFLHVTRTAGSTLRVALYRQFPPGAVLELDPPPSADPTPAWGRYVETGARPPAAADIHGWMEGRLRSLPRRRRERLRLVIGHFFYGIDERLEAPSTYVTLLRDPVDRILSQYHLRRTRQGLSLSLEEYLDAGRDWQVADAQTRLLAGRWARGTDRMGEALAAAKRHLEERFAAVGLTERFEESLALLRARLGWSRLAAAPENVSEDRPRREEVPDRLLERLHEMNRHDAELHRFAGELLDEGVRSLPQRPAPAPPSGGPPIRWRVAKAARRLARPGDLRPGR